ncbi:SAM-dependent methyltransferase [Vibrio nigripulchritudo]|nr:SAM-dependent methyltransferase [Vibrio nigripulchritudo]BDU42755.1 SAM-dependent methyltransferase [Vibrio nigripulchritudo]
MSYYNQNAQEFFDDTINVDMSTLYSEFTPLLPANGLILDAGCGSGRDTKSFLENGFSVHSIDASKELAVLAEHLTKQPVEVTTFQEFGSQKQFDGVWACASLLHVPMKELPLAFKKLAAPLRLQGVFYCSFKYGREEVIRNGREFTNLDEKLLAQVISNSELKVLKTWCTSDLRKGRESEKWLNAILIKG